MPESMNGKVDVQVSVVLDLIAEKMYSSDVVFIRENVQNAVDAVRLQKADEPNSDEILKINVRIEADKVEIEDWGIGMTSNDIQEYFWSVGRSSKNNEKARKAGCIGQFGVGGFANFGRCSEVHVYTAKDKNSGYYSFVTKENLKKDNREYKITPSDALKHRGTLIRCLPLVDERGNRQKFNVTEILDYLKRYIEYIPEEIWVNGSLLSSRKFIETPNDKKHVAQKTGQSGNTQVEAELYVNAQNKAVLSLAQLKLAGVSYKVSGEVEFGSAPIKVYKHGFFLNNYKDWLRHYLSGNLDLPFVQPIANREEFDNASFLRIRELQDILAKLLSEYVSEHQDLLNNSTGTNFMELIANTGNINLLRDFEVRLADGSRVTLGYLKDNHHLFPNKKVYYAERGSENQASAFQAARNKVVMIGDLDSKTKVNVEKFLLKQCNGQVIPSVFIKHEFVKEELATDLQFLIEVMRQHLKAKGCSQVALIPCELEPVESMPFLPEEDKKIFYLNISHKYIKTLLEYRERIDSFDVLVDNLLLEFLSPAITRIRVKMFDANRPIFEYFGGVDEVKHEVMLDVIQQVYLVKEGGRNWFPGNENLLKIESTDFPEISGYFLKLPDPVNKVFGKRLEAEASIEVVWFLYEVFFIIYHDPQEVLKITIRFEHPVQNEYINDVGGHLTLNQHIKSYKASQTSTEKIHYLPIPEEIKENFIPKGYAKKIQVSPKLIDVQKS